MFRVSREIGSRLRRVIFTVRRAVFICGDTEAMVPCSIVPMRERLVRRVFVRILSLMGMVGMYNCTIFKLDCDCFVRAFHEKPGI
jgi:hypothetical protein